MAVSRFLTTLELQYVDGVHWLLIAPFAYDSALLGLILIDPGFITDFASIPRGLWNLLPPTGSYGRAAVIHDYLYRTPLRASRKEADQVLREAMNVLGVRFHIRWIIYAGVRLGGVFSYKGSDAPLIPERNNDQHD